MFSGLSRHKWVYCTTGVHPAPIENSTNTYCCNTKRTQLKALQIRHIDCVLFWRKMFLWGVPRESPPERRRRPETPLQIFIRYIYFYYVQPHSIASTATLLLLSIVISTPPQRQRLLALSSSSTSPFPKHHISCSHDIIAADTIKEGVWPGRLLLCLILVISILMIALFPAVHLSRISFDHTQSLSHH